MSNLFDPAKNTFLSKAEEVKMFAEYHSLPETNPRKTQVRERIIMSNTGFVLKTAQYYAAKSPTFYEDFVSAGFEGLLVAFDKYRPETGYRFLTYAGFWIRERILKTMSTFRIVMVPSVNQQIQAKVDRLRNRGLTESEIMEQFRAEQHTLVVRMMQNPYLTYSIEDLDEELSIPEVDLESPDYALLMELRKDLSLPLQENLNLFLSGGSYDQAKLEQALDYLRSALNVSLPEESYHAH